MQKVSLLGYDNYDERTEDNTQLLLLGKPMFDRCALLKSRMSTGSTPPMEIDIPPTPATRNSFEGEAKKSRNKRSSFSPESQLHNSSINNTPVGADITTPSRTSLRDMINNTSAGAGSPASTRNSFEGGESKRRPKTTTLQGAIDTVRSKRSSFSPESPKTLSPG